MGFVAGLLFGFAIGMGMVFGLVYMMGRRGGQRVKKSEDITLLGQLTQDDIKKLCGGDQPLWISFPQFERVRWLNKQLEKVWPSVAEAARVVIKESVEPILESYRPVGIAELKFSKLTLGNVAPQIEGDSYRDSSLQRLLVTPPTCDWPTSLIQPVLKEMFRDENAAMTFEGIRMQTLKPGQLTMDLDFRWGGDPSIVLGVKTLVGAVLPVQLKNFKFFATVRVIFQLSEDIPCISAVVVALLAQPKPEIKYTFKVIGGSLTAVPGLSDMIRDLVENAITDQLQWPHRVVVPISPNPGDLSDLYLKLQGQVTVTVHRAEKLKNMERVGKSDPYVVLNIRPLFKYKTKVIDNDLNPVWNETFALDIEDHETQLLHFKVMDDDYGQDKTLGLVSYPLVRLVPEESVKLKLPLLPSLDTVRDKDNKDRGHLILEMKYHVYTKEESDAAMQAEKDLLDEKDKLKKEGILNSSAEAVGGVVGGAGKLALGGVGIVGSGVGMVGTGILKGGKVLSRGMGQSIGNVSKKNRDVNGTNGITK